MNRQDALLKIKSKKGDIFTISVLNEVLSYKVEEISTILPYDTEKLKISADEDKATLMTCTPYGVNTHRLLITGNRTDNVFDSQFKTGADAVELDSSSIKAVIFLILLGIQLICWYFGKNN